eukprot:763395-Hanusia_phi.AAC.4
MLMARGRPVQGHGWKHHREKHRIDCGTSKCRRASPDHVGGQGKLSGQVDAHPCRVQGGEEARAP